MSRCGRLGRGPCWSCRGYCAKRICIDDQAGTRDELESDVRYAGFDQHCAIIAVIAHLTAWHRRCEGVDGSASQAIHKVGKAIEHNSLIFMIMAR